MSSIVNLAYATLTALTLPSELYGLLAALGVVFICAIATWFTMLALFASQRAALSDEQQVITQQFNLIGNNAALLGIQASSGAVDALQTIASTLNSQAAALLAIGVLGVCGLAYADTQNSIWDSYLYLRQCTIIPVMESLALPLLNLGRLLYALVWPLVNVAQQIYQFFTLTQFQLFISLVSFTDFQLLLSTFASAAGELASAIWMWLFNGLLASGRIDFIPFMQTLGSAFNIFLPILNQYCQFLNPLWVGLTTIPQLPSLWTTVDCAGNVPVRTLQTFLNSVSFGLVAPTIVNGTIEFNCAVISAGEFVRETVLILFNVFLDLLEALINLLETEQPASASLLTNRHVPVTVSNVLHAVMRTTASPVSADEYDPPFWQDIPPPPSFINDTIGINNLVALLMSDWPGVVTHTVAAAAVAFNQTFEAAFHISCPSTCSCLIDSPLGLAYLQLGGVANELRAAADSLASIVQVFTWAQLYPFVSLLLQAVVTFAEALLEMLFGWIYAIAFPTWSPGTDPPDTHCNVPCGSARTTCLWTDVSADLLAVFEFFPNYELWQTSALNRTYDYLELDADALAVALGCNLTTNSSDPNQNDCNDYPWQCFLRRTYQLAIELVSLFKKFFLLLIYLVQFSYSSDYQYVTFLDIDFTTTVILWNQTVDCLTSWIDQLDPNGQDCLSTYQGYQGLNPNQYENATLPPLVPYGNAPVASATECWPDGTVHYVDGRSYAVAGAQLPTNVTQYYCATNASNNGCQAAAGPWHGTQYYLTYIGAPPSTNVNITVSPLNTTWLTPVSIFVNTSDGYSITLPDPATWAQYNLVDADVYNCTDTSPPVDATRPVYDPIPTGIGCVIDEASGGFQLVYRPPEQLGVGNQLPFAPLYRENSVSMSLTPEALDSCMINFLPWIDNSQNYMSGIDQYLVYYQPYAIYDAPSAFSSSFLGFTDPVTGGQNVSLKSPTYYDFPENAFCRYNTLYYLNQTRAESATPFFIENFPNSRIPCNVTLYTPTYYCDALGRFVVDRPGGVPAYWAYNFNNTGTYLPVPCVQNPAPTRPLCMRADMAFTDPRGPGPALEVSVQVDGTNVRVVFNKTLVGEPTDMPDAFNWTTDQQWSCVQNVINNSNATALALDTDVDALRAQLTSIVTGPAAVPQVNVAVFKPNATYPYRNDSFICSLSLSINFAGVTVSAAFLEIMRTVQSFFVIVDDPPVPGFTFYVPTFAEALADLQGALCQLVTAATQLIPVTYECASISTTLQCATGAECAQAFGCAAVDVLTLALTIASDVLVTIKEIVDDNSNPTSSLLNNNACRTFDNAVQCVVQMLDVIVLRVIFALGQVARSAAANVDCLLCAIIRAADSSAPCDTSIYTLVDQLASLVDGIANDILTFLLQVVLDIIFTFVYLFSGQWSAFGQSILNVFNDFGLLLTHLATDLGTFIWNLLVSLPVIGPVFQFLNTIFTSICVAIAKLFGVCLSCHCKKRDVSQAPPNISWTWAPGGPAEASCGAYMNSGADADELFVLYCLTAAGWLNDTAAAGAQAALPVLLQGPCETLLPSLYAQGLTWPQVANSSSGGAARQCLLQHAMADAAQLDAPWLPQDLFTNWQVRLPMLADDLFYGAGVYHQYASDQAAPVPVLLSDTYQAYWNASGYDTSHLTALAAAVTAASDPTTNTSLVNATLAADLVASASPTVGLSLPQYAARRLATDTSAYGTYRARDPVTVTGAATFWATLMNTSVSGAVVQAINKSAVETLAAVAARPLLTFSPELLTVSAIMNRSAALQEAWRRTAIFYTGVSAYTLAAKVAYGTYQRNLTGLGIAAVRKLAASGIAATKVVRDLAGPVLQDAASAAVGASSDGFWVHVVRGAGLGALVTGVAQQLQVAATRTWNAGPAQLSALIMALQNFTASRAPARPSALANAATLYTYFSHVAADAYREAREVRFGRSPRARFHRNYTAPAPRTSVAVWGSIASAQCLSSYAQLCADCLWADNLVGTVVSATSRAIAFYSGPTSQNPSLAFTNQSYAEYAAYLADPSLPVVVGESAELPVRWPSPRHNNWRWFGDPTPDKLYFDDLASLWQTLWDSLVNAWDNSPVRSLSAVPDGGDSGGACLFGHGFGGNGTCTRSMTMSQTVRDVLHLPQDFGAASRKRSVAQSPTVNTSFNGWVEFFYSSVAVCNYGAELDGTDKRWSIGEAALIVGAASAVLTFIIVLPFVNNVLGAGIMSLGFTLLTIFWITLFVTYSFTFRCLPALPYMLADDVMWFLSYEVVSRCDWLLAAGYIQQDTYTNDHCYSCSLYPSLAGGGEFTCVNCAQQLPFADLGYYIGFFLTQYWPAAVTWIETTTAPFFSQLRTYAFVQDRLNAFNAYNATDEVQFSMYNRCAFGETLLGQTMVALSYLTLLALAFPLIKVGVQCVLGTLMLAYALLTATGVILVQLINAPYTIAAAQEEEALPAKHSASLWQRMTSMARRLLAPQEIDVMELETLL